VWDKVTMRPLSVAPPKASISLPVHTEQSIQEVFEAVCRGSLSVEEYADGFIIQVHQTRGDPTLFIATRSKRDASGMFYSSRSFRNLFLEVFGSSFQTLADTPWGAEKEQEQMVGRWWSYVVQHPEHRMVTPVSSPNLHLVQRGQVDVTGKIHLWEECSSLSLSLLLYESSKMTPEQHLQEWIQQVNQNHSWKFRGVVIKDRTGERWRFRSEKYMAIQALRGREASGYERYARIFTQNLSGVYLQYYPEDMIPFSLCGVFMNDITHTLYRMYHAVFVRKSTTLAQIHRIYRSHVYAIHGVYLTVLRPAKKWVTVQDIRVYLMQQPPPRIAFLIRHHQEEYHSRVAS
jgi:hypothetical protein